MKNTVEHLNEVCRSNQNNRLIVIGYADSYRTPDGTLVRKVHCICRCGAACIVSIRGIVAKTANSCGCYMQEQRLKSVQKYFPYIPELYNVWGGMISRCYDCRQISYPKYGAIGVEVCPEWRNDYQSFLNWALQHGYKKGLEIDKDIKGNGLLYSPDTCIWVTHKENMSVVRNARRYRYENREYSLNQLSEMSGLRPDTVWRRINIHGFSVQEAVETPKRKRIE